MKVQPKNDTLRRIMRHPSAGGFPPGGGPADWPRDQFTMRRIRDGDVTVIQEDKEPEPRPKRGKPSTS